MSDDFDEKFGCYFSFDERLSGLSNLISSIVRPGDYCAHGRFHTPMPRISSQATGVLAFPLQPAQLKELVALGERAPYGRGEETILDRSVRDCRQISPDQIVVGGASWDETFGHILDRAAAGLGYPADAVQAELYKFLLYEEGGFFSPHRDTEKADGMVATLVVALPVAGSGGELIIRHQAREAVVDMRSEDPSELVYAAFYADCEHEIRPVTEGHRACLVYNLVLTPGGDVAKSAPDYGHLVEQIASEIEHRFAAPDAPEKLVWLLEHDYSIAGLSFETLKNVDAAVGRVLTSAAAQAGCVMHAAIVHVDEHASVAYYGGDYARQIDDVGDDEYEIYEIYERKCELDDWVHPDLGSVDYGQLELAPDELMPPGRIRDWVPDESRLTEASGNEGAEVERLYRNAAIVLWPAKESLRVLAQAGSTALSVLLAHAEGRAAADEGSDPPLDAIALEISEVWPVPGAYMHRSDREEWEQDCAATLLRLCGMASQKAAEAFLDRIVVLHYGPGMNAALLEATSRMAGEEMANRLLRLVDTHFAKQPEAVVDLMTGMSDAFDEGREGVAQGALKEIVMRICSAVPAMVEVRTSEDAAPSWSEWRPRSEKALNGKTLRQIFQLAWRFDLECSLCAVAGALIDKPDVAPPDRTLPPVLSALGTSQRLQAAASPAFARLWQHSAGFLLARSGSPPADPVDWAISSEGLDCGCEHCAELVRFCADPVKTELRIPVRQDRRRHLRSEVQRARVDLSCETERKGRPYTLICTKTRDSHSRRRRQYSEDISEIKRLLDAADAVPGALDTAACLRAAVTRGQDRL